MKKPEPFFKEPYTAAAVAADASHFPYLCVLLQSLLDHISDQNHYDIIVVGVHLTKKMQQTAYQSVSECHNLMLRFINLTGHADSLEQAKQYLPWMMEKYSRVIYLESDWVLSDDIAENRNACNHVKSRDFLDLEQMPCITNGSCSRQLFIRCKGTQKHCAILGYIEMCFPIRKEFYRISDKEK